MSWEVLWNWAGWSFVGTALSALLGAGAASVGYEAWRHRNERKDRAAWLALRIAIALETFAVDCFNDAYSLKEARPDSQAPLLPVVPPLPEDVEGWRSLERALAERAMRLAVDRATAQGVVAAEFEHVDPAAALERFELNCLELGLEAAELAASLCRAYAFTVGDGELIEALRHGYEERKQQADENDQRARARAAEIFGD